MFNVCKILNIANMLAVNPFVKRIPTLLQDQYMDDIVSAVCQSIGLEKDCLRHDGKCPIPHNLAIIYARKSSEKCIQ